MNGERKVQHYLKGDAELSRGKSQEWLVFPSFELPRQVVYRFRALAFFLCLLGFIDFFLSSKCYTVLLLVLSEESFKRMILRLFNSYPLQKRKCTRQLDILS